MGCNTSKESVQPVGDEAKEDAKNGDIPKASEGSSAKVESQEASQGKTEEKDSKEDKKEEKVAEKEREEAATRIQAAFRGHHARKSMKETESSTKQTGTKSDSEPTEEQLQQEFRADDKELCEAATKIQASFRGHMSRKEQAAGIVKSAENAVDDIASKMDEKAKEAANELEGIDLTDPDLHKAATKIQASFRGHKVRQEVLSTPGQNEEVAKK
ncbi:IQ calmodulin-binding domain containing protein igloo isoform X2 [Osmia lignaria lignaria]|uniref:HIRA-interacting protein 3 n=1 Tax=Osmia bicornis bicornis TaxID=1437191 RepID=UPI0010F5FD9E|nr:HIRA-interacting protein 3 [Osmia bicornis bicornis]XP_034171462.1 HIRA-interacting protein 3 isoform X2 [Osmia lignaria]